MTDSLNKLIEDGLNVNIHIPTKTWVALGLAVTLPGIILIITAQTFKKL